MTALMFVTFQIFAPTVQPAPRRSPLTQIKHRQIQGSCTFVCLQYIRSWFDWYLERNGLLSVVLRLTLC